MRYLAEEIIKTKKSHSYLGRYVIDCFGRDISFQQCTRANMDKLAIFLKEKVSNNSASQYMAVIKSVLNYYADEGEVPKSAKLALKCKVDDVDLTYLTEEELKMFEEEVYKQKKSLWRYYGFLFLLQAYTGARVSDIENLSTTNIRAGRISYVSQKTGIKAVIPLKKEIEEWLDICEKLKDVNDISFIKMTYNRIIKQICMQAGITEVVKIHSAGKDIEGEKWRFISSHTARRSFATNLYLRGCDMYAISKMMGHSDATMTENYICCGLRVLSDEVINFFR